MLLIIIIIIIIISAKLKPRGDDKVIDNHISNAKLFIGKTNSWLKDVTFQEICWTWKKNLKRNDRLMSLRPNVLKYLVHSNASLHLLGYGTQV